MMGWKDAERISAKRMGGQRTPITGRQRGATPDHTTGSGLWAVELKAWKRFPAWLTDAMDQAIAAKVMGRAGDWPVVVLHPTGNRYENDLVIMQRKVWEEIDAALVDRQDGT